MLTVLTSSRVSLEIRGFSSCHYVLDRLFNLIYPRSTKVCTHRYKAQIIFLITPPLSQSPYCWPSSSIDTSRQTAYKYRMYIGGASTTERDLHSNSYQYQDRPHTGPKFALSTKSNHWERMRQQVIRLVTY